MSATQEQKPEEATLNNQTIYTLGIRDGIALVLAESKHEGIKLPFVAKDYKEKFGEHFSLEFHLSTS